MNYQDVLEAIVAAARDSGPKGPASRGSAGTLDAIETWSRRHESDDEAGMACSVNGCPLVKFFNAGQNVGQFARAIVVDQGRLIAFNHGEVTAVPLTDEQRRLVHEIDMGSTGSLGMHLVTHGELRRAIAEVRAHA